MFFYFVLSPVVSNMSNIDALTCGTWVNTAHQVLTPDVQVHTGEDSHVVSTPEIFVFVVWMTH